MNYNGTRKNINRFLDDPAVYKAPLILSTFSVILLTFAFPQIDQWYTAWIALSPWFVLIQKDNRRVLSSLVTGILFFTVNLYWLHHVTVAAWILLSLYSTAYFLAFGLTANYMLKHLRIPLMAIAPFIWVGLEYLRSFVLTGFPWLFLGHTQYQCISLIQIADITGVYGITFLIVMVNGAVSDLVIRCISRPPASRTQSIITYIAVVVPALMVSAAILYGHHNLKNRHPLEGPNLTAVQGNVRQSIKSDPSETQQIKNLQKHIDLSLRILHKQEKTDLIVWPETMVPGILNLDFERSGRQVDKRCQDALRRLASVLDLAILVGGTSIKTEDGHNTFFNSAFYLDHNGIIVDRYDKIHLVPFGEYTPLQNIFPFLSHLVPYEVNLSHGDRRTIFTLPTKDGRIYRFGVLICYEDTLPGLVSDFVNDGADFMINITNDGWFRKSAELDQHLAIMVFRAVENHIAVIRCANTGISAFIDDCGTIYARLTGSRGEHKEIAGILSGKVIIDEDGPGSWYTRHGDTFAVFCLAVTVITAITGLALRK